MSGPNSRQHRRALDRYAAGVEHVTAEDKRWFEQHPERCFRIRRMTAAEIGTAEAMDALKPLPPGAARFTLVRKLTADRRTRIFIFGSATKSGAETGEDVAEALWLHHLDRSPSAQQAESRLAAALVTRDQQHQGGAA